MTTAGAKLRRRKTKPSDEATAKRLVDKAMKQPGIRELTEVYEQARRYEEAAAGYRAILCPEPTEWASASSGPPGH